MSPEVELRWSQILCHPIQEKMRLISIPFESLLTCEGEVILSLYEPSLRPASAGL